MSVSRNRNGFTLIELTLVVLLVGCLAAFAAVRLGNAAGRARLRAAEAGLHAIRDAILGTPGAPGHLRDLGSVPGYSPALLRIGNLLASTNLYGMGDARLDAPGTPAPGTAPASAFLSWDAAAGRGWRGPYLSGGGPVATPSGPSAFFPRRDARRRPGDATFGERGFYPVVRGLSLPAAFRGDPDGERSPYGFAGEPAIGDPWGNPFVLQVPPPEAFETDDGEPVPPRLRFRYARVVSAGPDGVLSTPCFGEAGPTGWNADARRASRLAGRGESGASARGDDLVLFLERADLYEEEEP